MDSWLQRTPYLASLYIPLILAFLFADEIGNNFLLSVFSDKSPATESLLYTLFFTAQIIFSPIQAGISDRYCRRKSLIVSLSFSMISVLMVLLVFGNTFTITFAILILLSKGVLGNTLPISLAGVADSKSPNVRFSMGLCTGAMAAGYLALIFMQLFVPIQVRPLIIGALFLLLVFLCARYWFDKRDQDKKPSFPPNRSLIQRLCAEAKVVLDEPKHIIKELSLPRPRWAIFTFLLWEISQYSVHTLNVDLQIKRFSNVTTSMVCGYLLGLIVLYLCRKTPDYKTIRLGYLLCLSSIAVLFCLYHFIGDTRMLMVGCYFFYNFGTIFLAPSLFSILAKERRPHEQGKIFGLLESTDTVAFLLAILIAIIFNSMHLPDYVISIVSFGLLLVSWVTFRAFEKKQPL